ncbi:MAG TPA: YncE family protein [Blastocatellia bacterium]|nr:YncE family protein [Blastocatellia bacterium]
MRTRKAPAIWITAALVLLALLLTTPPLSRQTITSAAGDRPVLAGTVTELSIDDGSTACVAGDPSEDKLGFGWVNKLTPPTYPATLRAITIGFNRAESGVRPNSLFRIVVFMDPESDGPSNGQVPSVTFLGRVRGFDQIITFDLISPIRIESGSVVVGAIDQFEGAEFPALIDVPGRSTPPGSESFTTFNNGQTWRPVSEVFSEPSACNSGGSSAGSWLVRATVETDPVDVFETTETITDPLAVEPWSVEINRTATEAYVTNYGSDNLTVIRTSDNSFTNVPVGDGPGGTPDGPYGVTTNPAGNRVFVSLFGSNTVPTKAQPIDYSQVGDGLVQVFNRALDGTLTSSAMINVGKGPRFLELVSTGTATKLYVPCGGDDRVDVIDVNTNTKTREIAVGDDPSSCVTALSGVKLYVTNFGDGTISVINTRTDQKIKDIPVPTFIPPGSTTPVTARNPWKAAVSPINGNLYVTYWGTVGDVEPNGVIIEIDACSDEVVRAIMDDSTRGTPPGAEGGGGGPFGIASFFGPGFNGQPSLIYTNDGAGVIGAIDARTDQVISAPHITSCPRPRDLACARISGDRTIAYVACGLPHNSVLTINVPARAENISSVPVIEELEAGNKLRVLGRNFLPGARIQVIDPVTGECVAFTRAAKVKKRGTVIVQKGTLADGRSLRDVDLTLIRVINPDQTVRLLFPAGLTRPAPEN